VLRHLRRAPILVSLPVIMLCGQGDNDDLQLARYYGATSAYSKPFSFGALVREIANLVALQLPQ
jgi:DNA-binding response OmpR family regulator